MFKRNKKMLLLTSLITLLPMLMGLALWSRLPDPIATHFDFSGEPNGWSSKAFAVLGMPVFLLGVHLVCAASLQMDPKSKNIQDKMYRIVLWICPVISVLCCCGTYLYALGAEVHFSLWGPLVTAVMFLVLGNYLPKCRQSYTMGIRLPWTLADEDNWNATHRFAGRVWIVCGAVMPVLLPLSRWNTQLASAAFLEVITCIAHPCSLEQKDMLSAIARKTDDSLPVISRMVFMYAILS